ncbi:inverse autotransporter beta domain-containing protein [Providencia alcalifaciens]|uniref:inverse autotransporter beta domain-containing protein n=1 Tax=Providencia alcalifaciens TaxID=126385 RepID=UPI001CC70186|nr:inverse autotransporter beta domain-containing protein [Providencia alcalifaciens]
MQIAFPLSLSFTPIMLAHATEQPNSFLILPTTQTYTLKLDDTVASIAKQHGVTVNELKKLNQFRTFSKPFEDLTVGDEIDIPANTKWLNTPQQNELISSTDVARTASQLGSTFNNNSSSNAAKDLARSIAVGEMNAQTNSEISDWLQGKGKARVKIDVDNEFTLKNSELEVLVPIWELPEHMVFSQASLHRTDSRTQSNLGVGYRFFSPDYMLGINTFYDHDWSRSHSRVGLGAEYQRDFMKLSANSYHRTSDWKNSKDFDFYEERPANGWDVRAEGYLPAYPAIGGKLMYEQYYGDNVGLFGKDNQQKDPYAVTVGANYTPFPLLTFNAEQRQGKSGENDTRFGIDLKYTLGVPLSKQLDSEQIYASRLLNANRYDFVERNNNIVLEYRKKETITIQLPAQISGYTGEKRDIGLTISSKNGLSRVEWYAPELIAHGGQIIRESISQYSVVMPNYQYGSGANNHYTLSMVAYDESGNQSPESTTTVIVNSAAVDLASSKLSPLEVNLPNDGKSTEQLTLKLENKDGQPVSGIASEITTQITTISGSSSDIKLSEYTESANEPGTYYVTVTAGLSSGEFTLTPKIQGISISPAKVITGKSPKISNLNISGKLALGETLSGTYIFDANGSNTEDKSQYQWTNEGNKRALNGIKTVETSGIIPGYILVKDDVGKIKMLTVKAINGLNTEGNTETVTTAPGSDGNHTDGGNNGGIVDEAGVPKVSNVAISGKLNVGQVLSGSYVFAAQTGNPTDASVVMWGDNGTTVAELDANNGTPVTNGTLPTYTLVTADVGKVKAVSVRAKNGAGVVGNTETVTTAPGSDGNHTDGGNNGGITDETGAPKVSNVAISGKLNVGQVLSGSYTFDAQTGNPTDASVAMWGDNGTTVAELDAGNGTVVTDGNLPTYTLVTADVGKVKAVSVRAKNGAGVVGNTETVTTAPGSDGNHTDGGNNGGIIDEAGVPAISNVSISGKLNVGEVLSGSYVFAAQTGNPTDASVAVWGNNGTTVAELDANNGTKVTNGTLPTYTLVAADIGKVKAVSVRAKNGAGVVGNTITVTTVPSSNGNNTNSGNIDGSGSVIGYTFKLTPETLRLGETMKHQYTLAATDIKSGQSVTIPANTVTWSTKDSAVAVADSTGIITAKKEGSTSVIVKGIYKNQPFQAEAIINISPLVKSPLFGYGTGSSATVVVEPPNYTISVRCGGIVDNMGGIGGSGGTPSIVKDVSNVTKIVTNTGLYEKNNVLSSITFHYGDGTSQKCGREEPQTVTIVKSETYMIPNGYRLQGFTAFGGQYVTGVQYITVEK